MTQISLSVRRRWRLVAALGASSCLVLLFLWYIGVIGGNVREVRAGRFYRSAQLSGSTLRSAIQRHGVRSVINLRGRSDKPFYRSERSVCRALSVAHYDVSLSTYHLPKPTEMRTLLDDFDHAPKPIMIHCQGGSDRSGLASTVYEVVYEGVPLDRAEKEELTWHYGHFAFAGSWRMDRFFDLYRQSADGQSLRAWIVRSYPGIYARDVARG